MAERRASLMEPRIEELLERVDSKFTLVTLAAMRAREINDYYNQLGEGLGKIVPPQVTSVSRKPLSIALEEIEVGKISRAHRPGADAEAGRRRRRSRPTPTSPGRRRRPEPTAPTSADVGARGRSGAGGSCSGSAGGIAAYKAVEVCRRLVDAGVHVAPGAHRGRARASSVR